MIWLLIPSALVVLSLAALAGARALPVLVSALPSGEPERGLPRAGTVLEAALGLACGLLAFGASLLVPSVLDPSHPEAFVPLAPLALGLAALAGAAIGAGPRGRARLRALLFTSNRRYVNGRWFVVTGAKWQRLREVGRAPALVVLLSIGALASLAGPLLTAPAPPPDVALAGVPEELRGPLAAGIAAGDPEALAIAEALGAPSSEPPSWTSERHLGWTIVALVLGGLAALLVLTPGGMSAPGERRTS